MSEDKRTATDILLELEGKVNILSKRFGNVENLLKVLLNNINNRQSSGPKLGIPAPLEPKITGPISRDNFNQREQTNKFAELANQHGVVVDDETPSAIDTVIEARPSELPPDPEGEDMLEAPSRKSSRGQRGSKSSAKSSVSQVLYREEGQPLFLAAIEVLDQTGVLINQTRTNPKGRWLMALAPGEYQVHVLKRYPPDSGKESIDTSYQIKVPPSDKPMELTPLTLSEVD